MRHALIWLVVAALLVLGGCARSPSDPPFYNYAATQLPYRAAMFDQDADSGRCAEFRVVSVDGEENQMEERIFQLTPGQHEFIIEKDGNGAAVALCDGAGADPTGGAGVICLVAVAMCTMASHDACLAVEAEFQSGHIYTVDQDDTGAFHLVEIGSQEPGSAQVLPHGDANIDHRRSHRSGRTQVARATTLQERRFPNAPLDCRGFLISE